MSIAQIGGATSPKIVYGRNNTGGTLSAGDIVQADLVDGAGDGYDWTTPDIDLTKPESLSAMRGTVWVAEGAVTTTFVDQAHIAVLVEGCAEEAAVDGTVGAGVALGDALIIQHGVGKLAAATNLDFTVDAMTAVAGTGQDGTTPSGAEFLALIADVAALRENIIALVDDKNVVAIALEASAVDGTSKVYFKQN